ncbi:9861_t:CDS:2, partial [Acaulospora morrowiae]
PKNNDEREIYVKDPELNQVSNKHDLADVIMMLSMRPAEIDWYESGIVLDIVLDIEGKREKQRKL